MRRLALPLALSLLAHAALVALVLTVPTPADGPRSATEDDGPTLRLSLGGPERPKPAEPRPLNPAWNPDLEPPRIVSVAASGDPPPIMPASFHGGTETGGGGGIVTAKATGSPLLPVPPRPLKIVYLLDRSASMGARGALDRAVAELKVSLRALPAETRFQVFAYNRIITPLVPAPAGLALAEPDRVARAAVALDDLGATGSTDHASALRRGLALRPDLLFLLTDAADLSDADVLTVARANPSGTRIHVVELTSDPSKMDGPVSRLAADSGGTYRRVRPGG